MSRWLTSFALFITVVVSASAQTEIRWQRDLATAQVAARQNQKYLLVYVYEPRHSACVEMDRSTFSDPKVVAAANAFETVAINGDAASSKAFCERYRVGVQSNEDKGVKMSFSAIPGYLFLDPDGKEYFRAFGYYPPLPFIGMLQNAAQIIDLSNKITLNPSDARAHADLGHLYLSLERDELGKPLLEKAVKLDPQNAAGARGDAELDLLIISIPDNPELAGRNLIAFQFNTPETTRMLEIRYFLAVAQIASGKLQQAEKILLDFSSIPAKLDAGTPTERDNPDYRNPWTVRADMLLKQLRELQAEPKK
ncbi:MAG: thioredoxin fold domain-containing protein [Armatimonadia bacterium]